MRATIDRLIALPAAERALCEQAENFPFDAPAPPFTAAAAAARPTHRLATVDIGSVEAAELLARAAGGCGGAVGLLNFAHGYNCGGGFEHAGGSQEEDIFRETSGTAVFPLFCMLPNGQTPLARHSDVTVLACLLPRCHSVPLALAAPACRRRRGCADARRVDRRVRRRARAQGAVLPACALRRRPLATRARPRGLLAAVRAAHGSRAEHGTQAVR